MTVTTLRFQFDGLDRLLPEPVPVANEIVIDVESIIEIVPRAGIPKSRFQFGNPLRKLLFFVWREGVALTWSKVRAVWFQRRLERATALVVVVGRARNGRRCVCIGRQATGSLSTMTFPAELCAELTPDGDMGEGPAREVARQLEASELMYAEVERYSVHSGAPAPASATRLMRRHGNAPSTVRPMAVSSANGRSGSARNGRYSLTLLGCGAYPMAYTIPALRQAWRYSVVDLNPCIAAEVARRFRFRHADTDCDRAIGALDDAATNAVVIATYHSSHAELVRRVFAADARAKVLVEKPPVTELDDAYRLAETIGQKRFLEIGYNRRYATLTRKASRLLSAVSGPTTMTCVVKELRIPAGHWYHWPNQGTRVTGNLSHWFDLATYFIASNPVEIHATQVSSSGSDEVSVTITYEDASMCVIVASDRGSDLKGVQEWIEIRRAGLTVCIDDFVRLVVADESGTRVIRSRVRDKGHARMYREFERAVLTGAQSQYPVRDLLISTLLYTTATDMLRRGQRHRSVLSETRALVVGGLSCSA